MPTINDILRKELESLRVQYFDLTKKYAKETFQAMKDRKGWSLVKWYEFYGIPYEMKQPPSYKKPYAEPLYPKNENRAERCHWWRNYNAMETKQRVEARIIKAGFDSYLGREMKRAEAHFESSLAKLSDRIEKKEFDIEKLRVFTSHVGINIDTVLSDGVKTVRAWTVIASGPVQRPHYRYLVK